MTTTADQKQAMLQPPTGPDNPYVLAYSQLCEISYLPDPSKIPGEVKKLTPFNPSGIWDCIWGPVQSSDESNLVFVASYTLAQGLPPTFAAVVTKGTDVDINSYWGILEQIWEDLDVTLQSSLPWAPQNPALIANGTLDGLDTITKFTSNGKTLVQFLDSYLTSPANNIPLIVTTGHSLGGCLTTVLAPFLKNQLTHVPNLQILPVTFAAPTAGNPAFADYFQSNFNYSVRVANSLDVAPLAWGNISDADDIYKSPCNITIPDFVYVAIVGCTYMMWFADVTYAQPNNGVLPLTGSCSGGTSWLDEALYQHHATTYTKLLGGTPIIAPPVPVVKRTEQTNLRARFGPVASVPMPVKG